TTWTPQTSCRAFGSLSSGTTATYRCQVATQPRTRPGVADRIEHFTPSCAASTSAVVPMTFTEGEVLTIEVYIPKGHAGLTTFFMGYGTAQVIPYQPGDVLTGDDVRFTFDIDSTPTGGTWAAFMENDDVYAHSWEVTYYVDEISADQNVPDVPL